MAVSIIMTAAGAQPTPPATLLDDLIQIVLSTNSGYTARLPGSLIEDLSSTEVAGLSIADSAVVETINSVGPLGANLFILAELGQVYIGPGSAPAPPTNTSVAVIFTALDPNTSAPLPGYVVTTGFVVSDGTYQYIVQDDGVTDSNGNTLPLLCVSPSAGSWAVATNTVTAIATSVPSNVALTCANPTPGISGAAAETAEQYLARVMQAGQAIATGTPQLLKTLLGNVPGVQQRLVSVRQKTASWEIIVGGGDPYLVAGEIFSSGIDISTLVGSTISVTNITNANPGVITTDLNHGYSNGQACQVSGVVGMTPINGIALTATVVDEKRFSCGVDTTGYPAYVSGGVLTPNLRNVTPALYDAPDIYLVPFVVPPAQTVTMSVTYSTTALNFTSQASVAQLAAAAIAAYVNAITVGGTMSVLLLEGAFLAAVTSVLPSSQVSGLTFAVSINGVSTAPVGKLISGDPESYFQAASSGIAVSQV